MSSSTIQRSNAQRIAIILAVVIQIGSTFLPALGFGEPVGNRSDSVRSLITPSGWAFAIWGPLFLGSAIFAIWQALPAQRENALVDRIGWWSAGALSAQGFWAVYTQFANLTWISVVIIVFSLVCLLAILRVLVAVERPLTGGERWFAALIFSALAAWLTAATIVNISAALVYHGLDVGELEPQVTAAILIVGGVIASLAVLRSKGAPWYALVFCWALTAIYFRSGQDHAIIAYACIASGIAVAAMALRGLSNADNRRFWLGI